MVERAIAVRPGARPAGRSLVRLGLAWAMIGAGLACAKVDDACEGFCTALCARQAECGQEAALSLPACVSRCRYSVAPDPLTCASSYGRLAGEKDCAMIEVLSGCPAYCSTLCGAIAGCGGTSDPMLCQIGCQRAPALCNLASIATHSCDQLLAEAACYAGNGGLPQGGVPLVCPLISTGDKDSPCNAPALCRNRLGCRRATGTCGLCDADYDCAEGYGCDDSKLCQRLPVPCSSDSQCARNERCGTDGTCRQSCSQNSDCPDSNCNGNTCGDPVGSPCRLDDFEACGGFGADCIDTDSLMLRVDQPYCTRDCGVGVGICPPGYSCTTTDGLCRRTAAPSTP